MARQTIVKNIAQSTDDGFVNHDLSGINFNDGALMLGYMFYDLNGYCDYFQLFREFDIPKGSVIEKATLNFNVWDVENGYVGSELHLADENDAPGSYNDFDNLTPLNEFIPMLFDESVQEQTFSYDVTDMIQEKIDSENWVQGSNFIFFSSNTYYETSDSGVDIDSWDYQPIASLSITFIPPTQLKVSDILAFPRTEGFKYQLLSLNNGSYIHNEFITNKIENAMIDYNFTRDVINTCTIAMKDYTSINYLNDLIRVKYWINYQGTIYEFPLGTYLMLSPQKDSDGKVVTRNIFCYDLLYALVQDKITASVTYASGTNVITTIKSILDSVGSWVKYIIDDASLTLSEDMSYEVGRSKLFIINSLLNTINYEKLFCDGFGNYRAIPWNNDKKIVWDFEDNNQSLYEKGVSSIVDYTNVYNYALVIANQLEEDTEPLIGTYTFEDEGLDNHPLSITSLGRTIVQPFESEAISQSYVDGRARRELLKMLEIENAINYKHALVINTWNDGIPYPGDCYKFKNTLLNINSIYRIESFTYQLQVGQSVNSIIRRIYTIE